MAVKTIDIITIPVGQMQSNCYLYVDTSTLKTIIIDAGDDAEYITNIIIRKNLIPQLIVATHGHFDHIMAVTELKLTFKIPFKINCQDDFLVKNIQESAKHFLSYDPGPPPLIDGCLKDKDKIILAKNSLEIIEVTGHTPGSICLYDSKHELLFTGDTLFADRGIGRTDFKYSSTSDLGKSLKKIFKLNQSTEIYPGHGRASTLDHEKEVLNYFV